jgi:hypothetical protein
MFIEAFNVREKEAGRHMLNPIYQLNIVVGRGLLSCWPLILGGDASRMPASGGGGTQGLDCFESSSSRVLVVKRSVFFVDRSFPN